MSLNDLNINESLSNQQPATKQKICDEVFNLKMRVKRKLDAGLTKDEANDASELLAALEAIEQGLNED